MSIRTQHPSPAALCCDMLRAALQMACETHDDPFDCPDSVVAYNAAHDRFGLIVHDGDRNVILINHCPWCGASLSPIVNDQQQSG